MKNNNENFSFVVKFDKRLNGSFGRYSITAKHSKPVELFGSFTGITSNGEDMVYVFAREVASLEQLGVIRVVIPKQSRFTGVSVNTNKADIMIVLNGVEKILGNCYMSEPGVWNVDCSSPAS